MPSYLQVENLSKSYGPKVLFEHIAFNINEGDKIALIAPNGTGKTSLLRILAGKDKSDSGGSIKFLKDIRIAFLEQEFDFDSDKTIAEQIFTDDFGQQLEARRVITELGLSEDRLMGELSGGEVKRVAVAQILSCGADFLILDEPTNHLDIDAIEYLEKSLRKSRCTLFMVTHDRYFLDRVCNTVMEMDHGAIYIYKGDYENYLQKRTERIDNYNARTEKVRNILRRELEWIHATPCARSGKAKYRKQAFLELKDRAEATYREKTVSMGSLSHDTYLGGKVINCKDMCFAYGEKKIADHFTYNFQRGERVGIVGENGAGKTTFLGLLAESNMASVQRGESVKIGYYRQKGIEFKEDDTVLDIIPDTYLLEKFLFSHDMFNTRIARLSGGERRRLYLLTVLMQQPNLLILDEPTNDLDIVTLNILEEYLLDFKGNLIIVTHDRHFLDRLVDHLLVFCGEGRIKDFTGGYTEYRSFIEDLKAEEKKAAENAKKSSTSPAKANTETAPTKPRKLSYKEQKELEALETRLEDLNAEKESLEEILSGSVPGDVIAASERYAKLKSELDDTETRWLELSCI